MDVADGLTLCLHTGTAVHSLVTPPARYVRTSADPVKGMIRRIPAGPTYHRVVCSRCGMWAVGLYWMPSLLPRLFSDPAAIGPLTQVWETTKQALTPWRKTA